MTIKGFLAKTQTKAANSAGAFLSQYRDWLETGELAQFTSPILAKMDAKEILPTPALKEITGVVFAHMMAGESLKADKSVAKSNEPKEEKPCEATLYTLKGEVAVDSEGKPIQQGFHLSQQAERWLDRRLVENPTCTGKIVHTKVKDRMGNCQVTEVTREAAFGRVYKERGMAAHKKTGVSMSKLGFGVKAKNDRFHFSHG
jgi:hypothetical protein